MPRIKSSLGRQILLLSDNTALRNLKANVILLLTCLQLLRMLMVMELRTTLSTWEGQARGQTRGQVAWKANRNLIV